ncbi:MAG: hypothetical protein NTZ19_04010 [Bacteroidetes bacterium]|nr:hypothetical protein [Bacteroidota bacterium]
MEQPIQILPSQQIDQQKWNQCINQSKHALIYADYRFLNALCDNWSGLIVGDYESVMPLPWRKKWGIRYLYAPPFIQQLGFYGNLNSLNMPAIWKSIFSFAKFGDLFFNFQNKELLNEFAFTEKTNFILNLDAPYPSIHSEYTQDLIKNLQKSEKRVLLYVNDLRLEESIHLFQTQYQERFPQFHKVIYTNFLDVCMALSNTNNCISRSVFTENGNEILATAVLLKNSNRLSLIMNATTQTGRTLAANHFLIDQIIQEFSEEKILFDFEGSELKGVKEFYASFHPVNQPYFQVSYNRLPSILNWIRNNFFVPTNQST